MDKRALKRSIHLYNVSLVALLARLPLVSFIQTLWRTLGECAKQFLTPSQCSNLLQTSWLFLKSSSFRRNTRYFPESVQNVQRKSGFTPEKTSSVAVWLHALPYFESSSPKSCNCDSFQINRNSACQFCSFGLRFTKS